PSGWKAYFKGGWGSGTGHIDNQVALLVHSRTKTRVSVAVLTLDDGSHSYGKETLRGIFKRLLRGLHPWGCRRRRSNRSALSGGALVCYRTNWSVSRLKGGDHDQQDRDGGARLAEGRGVRVPLEGR